MAVVATRKRHGKIAQLPHSVRRELNARIQTDQESQADLVTWLNGLPEVQARLAAYGHTTPITQQNLSQWKQGGYQDWLQRQADVAVLRRTRDTAEELELVSSAPNGASGLGLLDDLATLLTTEVARLLDQPLLDLAAALADPAVPEPDPDAQLDLLLRAANTLTQLQRGDAARDQLRAQVAVFDAKEEEGLEERFIAYAQRQEIKTVFRGPPLSREAKYLFTWQQLEGDYIYDREQGKIVHVQDAWMNARRIYAESFEFPWDGPAEPPKMPWIPMPWEDDWPAYAASRVAELRARNLEVPESLITPSVKGPDAYLSTAPPDEVVRLTAERAAPDESLKASWPPPRPPRTAETGSIPDADGPAQPGPNPVEAESCSNPPAAAPRRRSRREPRPRLRPATGQNLPPGSAPPPDAPLPPPIP